MPGSVVLYTVLFALGSLALQVWMPDKRYVNLLKWLTFALFAYVATVFLVRVPWGRVLRDTLLPQLSFQPAYLAGLIAVLGTTISPYLFFWQASEEAEDEEDTPGDMDLLHAPEQAPAQLHRINVDTLTGMAVSNTVAFCIILTAAVTLKPQGVTSIQTAQEAAAALLPIAGSFAFALFTLGIVGTGLLAVPVLSGSVAYAVGEALGLPVGLERKPIEARFFYVVLIVCTLAGLGLDFIGIDPIQALFWFSVINGMLSAPLMVVLMVMACSATVMGSFAVRGWLRALGWLTTLVMFVAAIGFVLTLGGS